MYIAPKIRHVSMIVLVSGESEALARPSLATLSSGTSSQCSAVVHLRSGTSSQCSSGQSHFPVVHLRSAPTEPHSVVLLHSAPFRLLFFFFLFFLGIVILGIVIYGSSVATLFSSVLGSLFSSFSSVLQQVAALPSTRTNQMLLSGSPVSASPLASDIASWLSNESMSFLSFL